MTEPDNGKRPRWMEWQRGARRRALIHYPASMGHRGEWASRDDDDEARRSALHTDGGAKRSCNASSTPWTPLTPRRIAFRAESEIHTQCPKWLAQGWRSTVGPTDGAHSLPRSVSLLGQHHLLCPRSTLFPPLVRFVHDNRITRSRSWWYGYEESEREKKTSLRTNLINVKVPHCLLPLLIFCVGAATKKIAGEKMKNVPRAMITLCTDSLTYSQTHTHASIFTRWVQAYACVPILHNMI